MKRKICVCVVFLVVLFLSTSVRVYAVDSDIPFAIRMPYRIVRGCTNVFFGWTEMLVRPIGEWGNENVLEAFETGAINTMIRLDAGITDVRTFWDPNMQMEDLYPDWETWPYIFHWS